MQRFFTLAIIMFSTLYWTTGARAHTTQITKVHIEIKGDTVTFSMTPASHDIGALFGMDLDPEDPVPLARFKDIHEDLQSYIAEHITVKTSARCTRPPPLLKPVAGDLKVELVMVFTCPPGGKFMTIKYSMFLDLDPKHRALGALVYEGGTRQVLFDAKVSEVSFERSAGAGWAQNFWRILKIGIEHILSGYDHLLFLACLVMIKSTFWRILKVVTAFTIAHSITLGIAWFGLFDLPGRLVETMIALSIGYVALENMLGKAGNHRWMIAAGFGFIHGLGFYGALKELDLGQSGLVTTLLAFNLGVETGQMAIVAVFIVPLIWWWRQGFYKPTMIAASAISLAFALWWAFERAVLA